MLASTFDDMSSHKRKRPLRFAAACAVLLASTAVFRAALAANQDGGATNVATRPQVPVPGAADRPTLTVSNGLVCWFDAAVGVVTGSNGVVQSWRDLSGRGHDATLAAGAPTLAANQLNGRPALQFRPADRQCGFTLDGPFFTEEQFVVVRSPQPGWSHDGCFLGRRWARHSSYRLNAGSTKFMHDQFPLAVSRNGQPLHNPPFDLGTITDFMILKIDVNAGDMSPNTYQLGIADGASCDFDVAEIIGYQTRLSPPDEALVGSYLAAKYGIKSAYPPYAGLAAACTLAAAPAGALQPTAAELAATLHAPGAAVDIIAYWGRQDGGTDVHLWEHAARVGAWTNAAAAQIKFRVAGLTPGTRYYFTFRGTNALDSFWAAAAPAFRTPPAGTVSAPPRLTMTNGLVCWFDAGTGVVAGADGVVQAWSDLSGQAHHAAPGGGAARLAANQLGGHPAVQFRKGWLALAGTFCAREHYLVLRSPTPRWNGASGLLGRLKGRGSSYNTWGGEAGFWQDQQPTAVSRNGVALPGPSFDCSPLGQFMILKIVENEARTNAAAYAIGNNDGLTSCDFDVTEILGFESLLSPDEEDFVGGYLAAKYGLDTAYPTPPGAPVPLAAADTAPVKYRDWRHSGSFYLLTTPDGADLPAGTAVENFPVLVRLDKDGFNFAEAEGGGADLRFAAGDRPLAYQIETWDAAAGTASVWVRVPSIQGHARQELKMYWGRPGAPSESSGAAVFNRANGFLSVWHMDEPVRDEVGTVATTDLDTAPAPGMIGSARHFSGGKGISGGDRITGYPFASSPHTSEAWVRYELLNRPILSWGQLDGVTLRLSCPPGHVVEQGNHPPVNAATELKPAEWVHVACTYDGQHELIYINGRPDMAPVSVGLHVLLPVRL